MKKITKNFPKHVRAVLFDYDGVIVDSMEDNFHAWERAFADYHVAIARKSFFPLEGMSPFGITSALGQQYHVPKRHYKTISTAKDAYYYKYHVFRLFPNVTETLETLKRWGIRIGLVTGGIQERLLKATPEAVLALFDVIVTSEMVTNTKPDPEPYAKALELLFIPPTEALVVENAVLGVMSAQTAGIYCLAVPTTSPCSKLDADYCMKSISEIPALITAHKG